MQFRCIVSAIRPGGYARAVQIECSHGASRLIRLVQLRAFAAGRRASACGSPGLWRLAAFWSARPDRPLPRLAAAMPPGSSALPGSRSPCAGQPADGDTRSSPDGITAARDSSLSQADRRQQERGYTCNRTQLPTASGPPDLKTARLCPNYGNPAVIPDGQCWRPSGTARWPATKKTPWPSQNVTYSLVDAPPRCPERRLRVAISEGIALHRLSADHLFHTSVTGC